MLIEKFSQLKKSNLVIKKNYTKTHSLAFSDQQGCVARKEDIPVRFYTSSEILMSKMNPLVFEKGRFVIQENQTTSTFWLYRFMRVAMQGYFPGTLAISIDRCPAHKNLLTETMIEVEVVLKRIESVYRDDLNNYSFIDNF